MKRGIRGFVFGIITAALLVGSPVLAEDLFKTIKVQFNAINVKINGEKVAADNILYNGTTYIPFRKVAELLDKNVEFIPETNTARITNKSTGLLKISLTKQAPNRSLKDVEGVAKAVDSTVLINVYDYKNELISSGSGVFINNEGYIITNYHVIELGYNLEVVTNEIADGKTYTNESIEIINYDSKQDLALLKINTISKGLYINTTTPNLGSKTVAIGSPLGLINTVSEGIVSGFRKEDGFNYIQTSAPISPGSSGGALLNMYGELIGITSAGYIDGENLNLAIPSSTIKDFLGKTSPVQKRFYTQVSPIGKYIGEMNGNLPDGYGTMFWNDGEIYTGYFKKGIINGNGTYYYNNGDIYTGSFVDSKMDGMGVYFYNNGDIYIGEFVNDNQTGIGYLYLYYYDDVYLGMFNNGYYDGYGIYHYYDGDLIFAKFMNDDIFGEYVYVDEKGKTFVYNKASGSSVLVK